MFNETFAAHNRPEDMALYLAQAFGPAQQRTELEDPAVRTLLGEVGGDLAAYAQLRAGRAPDCVSARRPIELSRFYVDGVWQGRGIAAELLAATLAAAAALGGDALWLGVWERNARAIAFYGRHGFARIGEQAFMLGTDAQTDGVMARPLTGVRAALPCA